MCSSDLEPPPKLPVPRITGVFQLMAQRFRLSISFVVKVCLVFSYVSLLLPLICQCGNAMEPPNVSVQYYALNDMSSSTLEVKKQRHMQLTTVKLEKLVKQTKKRSTKMLRIQGIEPWSVPWEGTMIPLHQMR